MRAHYFQHVPFEGIGNIEDWLIEHHATITGTHFFAHDPMPAVDDIDLLIVMGGPMSVNDEAEFPWLIAEKHFIRTMITAGKPVIGICLGAQLITAAFGARVAANPHREIGWFKVNGIAHTANQKHLFQFPSEFSAFHWHGETFELPPGAQLLASSEACHHQAFQLGNNVIGLQFHLETTPILARSLLEHGRNDLVAGKPYIQTETAILAAQPSQYAQLKQLMASVLKFML